MPSLKTWKVYRLSASGKKQDAKQPEMSLKMWVICLLKLSFNPRKMSTTKTATLTSACILLTVALHAQLTLRVTAIPTNTPVGANVIAAGTFNNWNPGSIADILAPQPDGSRTLTINPPAGTVKFKFTRGAWSSVEGNASGGYLPDREISYSGQPTTVDLTILSWEDLSGGNMGTAAPNVQLLDNDFYMPQLNRTRRIWVYLPPDYATATSKNYPVLYMHDGQNLFNTATAAFGTEWEVDESLNALQTAGNYGCIVVGIDNDGIHRLDEYSPWVNAQYGGGEGELYVQFITETLKPHIDSLYRTQEGRQGTGIMGSSMGGLISLYAFSERQDVFAKAGIFSPAFWFAGNQSAQHTASHPSAGPARVYFLAGGAEPSSVAANMNTVADAMFAAGFSADEQLRLVQSGGEHSEWFWAQEFPAAYLWLFPETTVSSTPVQKNAGLEVFPNPALDVVRFSGAPIGAELRVQFVSAEGVVVRDTSARAGEALSLGNLPGGLYTLRIWVNGQPQPALKLVKGQ